MANIGAIVFTFNIINILSESTSNNSKGLSAKSKGKIREKSVLNFLEELNQICQY